jgi:hypothetical protein
MATLSTSLTNTAIPISPLETTDVALTVMLFCNLNPRDLSDPSAGIQKLDIFVVPSGGTPTPVNKIGNQIPVEASDTIVFSTERIVLSQGDRIFASTTNSGQISATVSYVKI